MGQPYLTSRLTICALLLAFPGSVTRAGPSASAAVEKTPATFRVSVSSSDVVLEMWWTGGLSRMSEAVKVYPNGRVTWAQEVGRSGERTAELPTLDAAEVEALVAIAVDGGLLEIEQVALRDTSPSLHSSSDSGMTRLEVHLVDYESATTGPGPRSCSLKMKAVASVARRRPDSAPVQAMAEIQARLLRLVEARALSEHNEG